MDINHDCLEILAKQLCRSKDSDWDKKGCKRNGWRKKAAVLVATTMIKRKRKSMWSIEGLSL